MSEIPVRKTTNMALNAVVLQMSKAFQDVATAAKEDGEAPAEYVLDVDRRVWRKPDIAPVSAPSTSEPETTTTSSG